MWSFYARGLPEFTLTLTLSREGRGKIRVEKVLPFALVNKQDATSHLLDTGGHR
jgi:hypothetical protein